MTLARELRNAVDAQGAVVIHCRAGIGRSSLLAAAVLVDAGWTPKAAFAQIALARGRPVPETDEQKRWLEAAE